MDKEDCVASSPSSVNNSEDDVASSPSSARDTSASNNITKGSENHCTSNQTQPRTNVNVSDI